MSEKEYEKGNVIEFRIAIESLIVNVFLIVILSLIVIAGLKGIEKLCVNDDNDESGVDGHENVGGDFGHGLKNHHVDYKEYHTNKGQCRAQS